jgi:RNA-directed DNA polymerase
VRAAQTPQPAAQGGKNIAEAAGARAGVGVPRGSVDPPESKTGGERRRGTCVQTTRNGEGCGDGRDEEMNLFARIGMPAKIQKLQRTLYRKARAEPGYRFYSLYGELLRDDLIATAMRMVANNGGAAGVDGETCEVLRDDERKQEWKAKLIEELRTRRYRPSPVLRVYILKDDGKQRPLGIPTVKDRVVQTAVALLLLPIWEADGHPNSYAYRPKRNAHQAVDAVQTALLSGRTEVIDADLSGYFDSIPHAVLLRLVARRVSDGSILALIKAWLRAPVVERDERTGHTTIKGNKRGTPQGGVISPLLANLYLERLDWQVNERCEVHPKMVRYADDFVILARPGQGAGLMRRLESWLTRAGLKLNVEKTRLVNMRDGRIKFLGFEISGRKSRRSGKWYPHVEAHPKSRMKMRDALRASLNHWTLWRKAQDVVGEVNRKLKGWGGYFHHGHSTRVFARMNEYARQRLGLWLWRKHGCRGSRWKYMTPEHLQDKLGLYRLPEWAAWKRA